MKPSNYDDWKNCITVSCGIALAADYIRQRISDLEDPSNYHTQKFKKTWGETYLETVIGWFERARTETSK
ncbi:MAG: hypothetical protein ABJG88_02405 [Litorimonas sp.]